MLQHPKTDEVAIYSLSDPRTPELVRYVGRSRCIRNRHIQHVSTLGPDSRSAWVESLWLECGLFPKMSILEIVPKGLSIVAERDWILKFPKYQLVNTLRGSAAAVATTQTELLQQLRDAPPPEVVAIQHAFNKFMGVKSLMLQYLGISHKQFLAHLRRHNLTLDLIGPAAGKFELNAILASYKDGVPTLRLDKEAMKFVPIEPDPPITPAPTAPTVAIDPTQNSHESRNTVCSSSAPPT